MKKLTEGGRKGCIFICPKWKGGVLLYNISAHSSRLDEDVENWTSIKKIALILPDLRLSPILFTLKQQ